MSFSISVEFSAHLKITFFGAGRKKFFTARVELGPQNSEKIFHVAHPIFAPPSLAEVENLLNLSQKSLLAEFSAPWKNTFLGRGSRNFFGPHQVGSIKLRKKFSWCSPHFRTVYPCESQKTLILAKNRKFRNPFWSKFLHVGARPAPKNFSELQSSWSISKNFFGFLAQI